MATPTISFNSSTGSDSNSGSGGTAITGSAATTSGLSTTISLDGSPDLSALATDGSAVIRLDSHGFYAITGKDNAAKTVTVGTALDIRAAGRGWGIGGKLASIDAASSRLLAQATGAGVADDSGTGGAGPSWILSFEDDTSATVTGSTITWQPSGTGDIYIQSSVAGTRRTMNMTANAATITHSTTTLRLHLIDLKFTNSNGTKTNAYALSVGGSSTTRAIRCEFGDATNTLKTSAIRTGGNPIIYMFNCAVHHCTSSGVGSGNISVQLYGCEVYLNTSHGIDTQTATLIRTIVAHNGGSGLNVSSTFFIQGCTFDQNAADGITASANNLTPLNFLYNCLFTGHSGAGDKGINFTGTTPAPSIFNNVFNNNTTNAAGVTLDSSNQTGVDPTYTNSASGTRNYTPTNTALEGDAFPNPIGLTGPSSYQYPGAVQPQGSGGIKVHPGMSGGING